MPSNAPYFPSRLVEISPWLTNFSTLLTATPVLFGLTAGNAVTVAAQNAAWQTAYTAAQNPATRTVVTIAAQTSATQLMRASVLPFATLISANPAVTAPNKEAIGVTVRITSKSPVAPPAFAPALDLVEIQQGVTRYRYFDIGTPSDKAKPYGALFVEIVRTIGPAATVDPDAGSLAELVTKAPFNLSYSATDRGKTATLWARFRNRSGVAGISATGPWSAALSHIIA